MTQLKLVIINNYLKENISLITKLIIRGANVNNRNNEYKTAFDLIKGSNNQELKRLLEKRCFNDSPQKLEKSCFDVWVFLIILLKILATIYIFKEYFSKNPDAKSKCFYANIIYDLFIFFLFLFFQFCFKKVDIKKQRQSKNILLYVFMIYI